MDKLTKQDKIVIREQETWLDPSIIIHQVKQIQHIMQAVMKKDTHYGAAFPGNDKPTLLKPGAEKLCLAFRLDPQFEETVIEMSNDHREYKMKCTLYNIVTEQRLGSGVGTCSTKESKYRYRQAELKCPDCGMETIRHDNKNTAGGWYCWFKIGGCGKKFKETDKQIIEQPRGRVENKDIADTYNTVFKIAKKRALVDAVLTVTAASDIFTQDLEDLIRREEQFQNKSDREIKEEIELRSQEDIEEGKIPNPSRVVENQKESNNNHTTQEYQDLNRDCAYLIWLMKRSDQTDIDNAQYQVEIQWYEKQEHTLKGLQKALSTLTEKVEAEDFKFPVPTPEEMDEWVKRMKEVFNVSEDTRLYFDHFRADGAWNDLCRLYFDAGWEYEHQGGQK